MKIIKLLCNKCLSQIEVQTLYEVPTKCLICGSRNIEIKELTENPKIKKLDNGVELLF